MPQRLGAPIVFGFFQFFFNFSFAFRKLLRKAYRGKGGDKCKFAQNFFAKHGLFYVHFPLTGRASGYGENLMIFDFYLALTIPCQFLCLEENTI